MSERLPEEKEIKEQKGEREKIYQIPEFQRIARRDNRSLLK